MHLGTEGFVSHAKTALQDEPLQEALQLLVHNFAPRRVQAMAALGNPEELRTQARSIKEHTIAHLDIYLEQFATQLDRLGVHVHWADDAAEARQIITSIAQAAEAKVVVKGKSMATEEIELNPHLEQHGFEVVETDLGEYIIQLAKESPSHIIAPAIHKTRRQIAELFHEKLQAPYTDEITEMTQLARRQLRQQFLRADVGITGVNFAIAETGSIVIVTNEGNGRLSSTLPKVHVALMGMEKLIPRLSDLSVMLKVLTNSATGQKISSYVTMMTGPRRAHDLDGPEALHVVMMDNGRSSILRSANREALYCLRCGACLNVCPIYQNIGGHAYGWVYPGPIGAVLTPLFVGLEPAHHLPRASTLCGACRDACPVKINIPHLLLNLRQELVEQRYVHWSEVWLFKLWARLMQHPRFYTWATRLAGWMQKPLARQGWIGKLPPPFHGWTQTRDFKAAAPVSFRRRWQQTLQHERAAPSGRGRDGYSQEAFLVRVRRALQSEPGPAPPAAPEPVLSETAETLRARLQAQRPQLVARLQEELSAVGGKVVRVQSVAEATQYVTQLALDLKASLIVRWQSEVLDALEIDASLEQAGIDLHLAAPPQVDASEPEIDAKRQEVRERLARAEIGLSGVDYAIAETGTLALSALPGQMRGVSLLPPVHVAVASSEQIVATLADCLALFQAEGPSLPERLSSCVSFITGPSRTGDIELSLTIGVHGPGELHLVILDGPEVAGRQEGS